MPKRFSGCHCSGFLKKVTLFPQICFYYQTVAGIMVGKVKSKAFYRCLSWG
jgi:hypothetical protein